MLQLLTVEGEGRDDVHSYEELCEMEIPMVRRAYRRAGDDPTVQGRHGLCSEGHRSHKELQSAEHSSEMNGRL